jgi:hypothetical protein
MTIFDDIGKFVEYHAEFSIKHIGVVLHTANDWGDGILHGEVIPLVTDISDSIVKESLEPLANKVVTAVGAIKPLFALVKAAYADLESFTVAVTYEF